MRKGECLWAKASPEDENKKIRVKDEYPTSMLNKEGGVINPSRLETDLADQIFIDKPRKSLDPYAGLKIAAGAEDIALAQKDQATYDAYKEKEYKKKKKKKMPEESGGDAKEIYKDKLKDLVVKRAFERIYGEEFSEDVLEKKKAHPKPMKEQKS